MTRPIISLLLIQDLQTSFWRAFISEWSCWLSYNWLSSVVHPWKLWLHDDWCLYWGRGGGGGLPPLFKDSSSVTCECPSWSLSSCPLTALHSVSCLDSSHWCSPQIFYVTPYTPPVKMICLDMLVGKASEKAVSGLHDSFVKALFTRSRLNIPVINIILD